MIALEIPFKVITVPRKGKLTVELEYPICEEYEIPMPKTTMTKTSEATCRYIK